MTKKEKDLMPEDKRSDLNILVNHFNSHNANPWSASLCCIRMAAMNFNLIDPTEDGKRDFLLECASIWNEMETFHKAAIERKGKTAIELQADLKDMLTKARCEA